MEIMKINRSTAENLFTVYYESPIGFLEVQTTEGGLRAVSFTLEKSVVEKENIYNQLAVKQLDEYFKNERTEFDIPLDLEGTDFQLRVWRELSKIPFGKTKSYMDIAKALGDPKAIRAVGTSNGRNKISIIIPCHRVIGSDGSLTGYAGGMERKKWLLDFENPPIQGELF